VKVAIHKWYLDSVSPSGQARINYAAEVRVGFLPRLRWCSRLASRPDGTAREDHTWTRAALPVRTDGGWTWRSPAGDVGRWSDGHPGQPMSLASGDGTDIVWTCHAAMSAYAAGTEAGLGYAESLRIELAEPRLPFKALWWGRAHAGRESLVWIKWAEGLRRCWLLRNGQRVDGDLIERPDGSVEAVIAGERWRVDAGRVLLDRDLRHALPRWLAAIGGQLALAHERKYLGTVTVEIDGGPRAAGTAIGEVVRWL